MFYRPGTREFRGRDGTRARARQRNHWHSALLQLDDTGTDPFHGHPVIHRGDTVGMVTSGAFGHRTGIPLALASFRQWPLAGGLQVLILGEPVAARILDEIPFDPLNLRCKS